jgi:hypothetical protein
VRRKTASLSVVPHLIFGSTLEEDLLKASFHLSEKRCRGLFAAAEELLAVEYPNHANYLKAEVKIVRGKHGSLLVVK